MANLLPIACILVACVGVSLLVSSVATNNWAKYTILIKYHEGLFTKCATYKDTEYCHKLHKDAGDVPGECLYKRFQLTGRAGPDCIFCNALKVSCT